MDKIMLLDGNSLINRAFYAMPVLSSKDGEFTNAVYGFLNIFQKLYGEEQPGRVLVAFDMHAPTFRHKMFADYKGTRKPMPQELRPQLHLLKKILTKMNITICELEGYEADDILGTYARLSEEAGLEVTVVSGDRDLLQIASDKTKIRIPRTKGGKTEVDDYYAADLLAELGLTPGEFIELKALMGDSSDNIPGVPGIGEKTALKIITEYKSVENAIANAEKITPKKASENLREFTEQALFSLELARICRDVPVPGFPAPVGRAEIFNGEAFEELQRLGFKSMYPLFEVKEENQTERVYSIVKTKQEFEELAAQLEESGRFAFKLVLDGDKLLGIGFCADKACAHFTTVYGGLGEDAMIELAAPLFEGNAKKLCHDLKGELGFLQNKGITLNNAVFDTMLAAYILDASGSGYEYDDIAREYLDEHFASYDDFFGKGSKRTEYTILNNDDARLTKFGCDQAWTVFAGYDAMRAKIEENGQGKLYSEIEFPLVHVLRDMETYGVKVDRGAIADFGNKLDEVIKSLTLEIYMLAGEEFNIASPKQLGVILFEKLGLKAGKKTKTGYSTAADVLAELSGKHEIIDKITDYRTHTKLKSTYVDGLLSVVKDDDRIYSTFNQVVTATGRISSTEPNLQNIPIRYALGRELRKVFIPENDDYVFLDADYSQIELRILAHISGDETFINAFREGQDIHRLTAAQVFGLPQEFVSAEQRSDAKAVNFGIVYGISAYSLSQDLGISLKEAQRYIDGYFERYPKVKVYLDGAIAFAKEYGYAETLFGRRRRIPELRSSNFAQRAFGERVAMNMPIQGSAADIIKIAMVNVSRRLHESGMKSRLILQVHDELLVEAYKPETEIASAIVKSEMENAASLSVCLEAEVKQGANWFLAH